VRLSVLFAVTAGIGFAQSQSASTTVITDLNGNQVVSASSTSAATATDSTQTKLTQSLNGRQVPLEQTEERVLRKDSTGKVTERIVRKYDPNGGLASTERVVTEEQATPGGGSTVHATTYRSDLNGRELETEQRVSETRVAGTTTTNETTIQRPTVNGYFETTERHTAVSSGDDANKTTTETVYRPSTNGGLQEAVRRVIVATKSKDQTVEQAVQYEPTVDGAFQLKSQTVTTTSKQPDGSQTTEVNLYGADAPGQVRQEGSSQQLQQQQIITRKKAADGSVIETLSVRRPSINDPNRLEGPEKVSETVCIGKCDSSKP
jgi:hypothetical protein